jgi:hypothetical protein
MSFIAPVQTTVVLNASTQAIFSAPVPAPTVPGNQIPVTNTLAQAPQQIVAPLTPPPIPVPGANPYPTVIGGVVSNSSTVLYGTGTGTAVNAQA